MADHLELVQRKVRPTTLVPAHRACSRQSLNVKRDDCNHIELNCDATSIKIGGLPVLPVQLRSDLLSEHSIVSSVCFPTQAMTARSRDRSQISKLEMGFRQGHRTEDVTFIALGKYQRSLRATKFSDSPASS